MQDVILTYIGYLLSCVVELWIIADFMNRRYQKRMKKLWVHRGIYTLIGVGMFSINLLEQPFYNFMAWLAVACSVGMLYYRDGGIKRSLVIAQSVLITVLVAVCEVIGYFSMLGLKSLFQIKEYQSNMEGLFCTIGTLIFLIAIYRFVLSGILKQERIRHVRSRDYYIYFMVMIFSIVNIIVLIPSGQSIEMNWRGAAILANGIILLLLNLFIGDLMGYLSENISLKLKLELLKERSVLQEEHFIALDKRYETALSVLHDVKKHIQVISELYQQHEEEKAISYTQDISGMLSPLLPTKYVSDHILNTILNDKVTLGEERGISFEMDIENVGLDFMEQIDITTIFGNILDNAVNACSHLEGEKKVCFSMKTRNDVLFLRIKNRTSEAIVWDHKGFPVSRKGEGHGFGLENVRNAVERYEGDITFECEGGEFICNISLTMTSKTVTA
ncbi:MAG: sensor histidine kinase [Lachnospiraceae bacterium]|nr:sensor histidine kinase [Lachnospiraceae bacterium]